MKSNEFSSIAEIGKSFSLVNFQIGSNIIECLIGKINSFYLSNKNIKILDKNGKKIKLIQIMI